MSAARQQRLHQLLAGPPSRERFREILGLFASWPEPEGRADALRAADAGLTTWPAETRWETLSSRLLDDPAGGVAPWASLVRTLDVHRLGQHGHRFVQLMRSPAMSQLAILDVTDSTIDFAEFANSPHVQHLIHLRLVNQGISERAAAVVAHTRNLNDLETLELVETTSAACFLDAAAPGRLHTLAMPASLPHRDPRVTELLARTALVEHLVHLDLSENHLRDTDALALAAATHLRNLRVLDLRRNDSLGPAAQQAIRSVPQFRTTVVRFGR